jgi:hypothetical protein
VAVRALRWFAMVGAMLAALWAVVLGLLWVAVFVSPWITVGVIAALVVVAAEPHRLVGR